MVKDNKPKKQERHLAWAALAIAGTIGLFSIPPLCTSIRRSTRTPISQTEPEVEQIRDARVSASPRPTDALNCAPGPIDETFDADGFHRYFGSFRSFTAPQANPPRDYLPPLQRVSAIENADQDTLFRLLGHFRTLDMVQSSGVEQGMPRFFSYLRRLREASYNPQYGRGIGANHDSGSRLGYDTTCLRKSADAYYLASRALLRLRDDILETPAEARFILGNIPEEFTPLFYVHLSHALFTNCELFSAELTASILASMEPEQRSHLIPFISNTMFDVYHHVDDLPFCDSLQRLLGSTYLTPEVRQELESSSELRQYLGLYRR